MKKNDKPFANSDLKLAAVCGLFCPSCNLFIGTQEDPVRLKAMAELLDLPIEEMLCNGCRSEKKSFYCRTKCKMRKCAEEKGATFCSECEDYSSCTEIKEFQTQNIYRIEVIKSLDRIKEVGYEQWYQEMIEHYSCPECNTLNSAYDISCRKCGATPSCNYVNVHKEEINQRQLQFEERVINTKK